MSARSRAGAASSAGGGGLDLQRLRGIVQGFSRLRLLVVGDVMLDEYLWGEAHRVSPEAPVPVVRVQRESRALGGAGNVARNVVAMGAQCDFCGAVGDDAAGALVAQLLAELGVAESGLLRVADRPTTRKTRVGAQGQQILRFDHESDAPLPAAAGRALLRALESALPRADGVVIEDYGKGVLQPRWLRAAMQRFRAAGLPVTVDPKDALLPYRGATLLKPNLREVEALTGRRLRSEAELPAAAARLQRRLGGCDLVVTRGALGMAVFESGRAPQFAPAAGHEVFDVQGAGDTCAAALALSRLAGATLFEAAVIANAAAGVVVGKLGTAVASPREIAALLPGALRAAREAQRRG